MNIVVNEELKAYIDPLTPQEHEALERSILAEGCRDALVLWGDLLIDGHNRYGICTQHGLPFNTVQATRFQTMEDVHLWMIDQHLGRRSVSDFQRGVLALRKKEIVQARQARAAAAAPAEGDAPAAEAAPAAAPAAAGGEESLASREAIARAARISSNQVVMIEKIRSQAAPEVVEAVKSGVISINAAAAVATLPQEEQVAAATAGKDELRQAAKRVREAKRKPAASAAADESAATPEGGASAAAPADELQALRERVAALTAENAALRARLQALGDHDASAPF